MSSWKEQKNESVSTSLGRCLAGLCDSFKFDPSWIEETGVVQYLQESIQGNISSPPAFEETMRAFSTITNLYPSAAEIAFDQKVVTAILDALTRYFFDPSVLTLLCWSLTAFSRNNGKKDFFQLKPVVKKLIFICKEHSTNNSLIEAACTAIVSFHVGKGGIERNEIGSSVSSAGGLLVLTMILEKLSSPQEDSQVTLTSSAQFAAAAVLAVLFFASYKCKEFVSKLSESSAKTFTSTLAMFGEFPDIFYTLSKLIQFNGETIDKTIWESSPKIESFKSRLNVATKSIIPSQKGSAPV